MPLINLGTGVVNTEEVSFARYSKPKTENEPHSIRVRMRTGMMLTFRLPNEQTSKAALQALAQSSSSTS